MLRVEKDEKRLRKQLDLKDNTSLDKLVPAVIKCLDALQLPRSAWVIKPSVAKRLLQANPPRVLMKQLGYRSVDSLLKREAISAILMGALLSEATAWRERLYSKYRQLKPTDCEMADVNIVLLSSVKWQKFFEKHTELKRRLIMPVPELGSLVILPLEATVLPGAALALLLSLVYHMNLIRSLSSQVKLQQVKPHFGQLALDIWHGRARPVAYMAEQPIYWSTVNRHFATRPTDHYPSSFDPHVQPDDLHQHTPEEVLVVVDPGLSFWHTASHAGMSQGHQVVSLHPLDAAINYCNQLEFENRSLGYIQEALSQELLLRYLREPHIHENILYQIETQPTVPSTGLG